MEAVIGLEIHVQLATETKIFCSCLARLPQGKSVADLVPNQNTCPTCSGQPGALPVLNKKAVEFAIKAGLATHCEIRLESYLARKNYFYPDMPKAYQITQYDKPICENGYLDIKVGEQTKRVRIQRIHIEEDAGKTTHHTGYSLVNLNRAGTPLIEVVTHPDLSSPAEAAATMRALYEVVTSIGVCDGNLQEGNFRCDANVSVRPQGSKELGTRTETKNVNSFRFVEKAVEYEIARQSALVQAGGRVVQETRLFDSDKNVTESMRTKEEAEDYRYFVDPDLLPIYLDAAWVAQIKATLPELPEAKRQRYQDEFGLSPYDVGVITSVPELALTFESALALAMRSQLEKTRLAKACANFLAGDISKALNEQGVSFGMLKINATHVAELAVLTLQNTVSSAGAKKALTEALKTGESIEALVDKLGLKQVSDLSAIEPIVDEVIQANAAQFEELKSGKDKLMGFFVGQIMKKSQGKANPSMIQELLKKKM